MCACGSKSKAGAHCERTTSRRTNLYPVGSAPYQAPSCVAARAKGSKEDGTKSSTRGVFHPTATVTHPPWIEVLLLRVYGAVSLYSSGLKGRTGQHQASFKIAPQSHQELCAPWPLWRCGVACPLGYRRVLGTRRSKHYRADSAATSRRARSSCCAPWNCRPC